MQVKTIEDGKDIKILLDPYELIHDIMSGEQRNLLIQSLACSEDIIKYVMQQVLTPCTDDGYSGSSSLYMNTAIQEARLQIAKESNYAVERTIKDLELKIASLERDVAYYRSYEYRSSILND